MAAAGGMTGVGDVNSHLPVGRYTSNDWSIDGGDHVLIPLKATVLVDGNHRMSAVVRDELDLV